MTHEHHFGQAEPQAGEARTRAVVVLTGLAMVVEVIAGLVFGSRHCSADSTTKGNHAVLQKLTHTIFLP